MKKILKILLVESDNNLGYIIKSHLALKGHQAILCNSGEEALKHYENEIVDFIISDIALNNIDGFALVEIIRKRDFDIPFIFLTSKSSRNDISKAFALGADDYIIKPFSLDELHERIEAISRRTIFRSKNEHTYQLSSYTFDSIRHVLVRNGEEKKLTTREMDLLFLFCEYKNKIVERSIALQRVWKKENYFNARNMDVYINKLRKYLKDDPNVEIQNVHGVGYKLVVRD